jgi:hypothetical protein
MVRQADPVTEHQLKMVFLKHAAEPEPSSPLKPFQGRSYYQDRTRNHGKTST